MSKPVIATRAGGPVEIVLDGVTGLLVPPASPMDLAAAIVSLLSNPDRAQAMGAAGRQRFELLFTVDRMAQATLEVYRRVGSRS